MLSARAYSFRQQSKLAISLSWIGGYTNIISVLVCHNVVSHMTGNTTFFGQHIADGNWPAAAYLGTVLASFVVGAAASGAMTEGARRSGVRSKYMLPIAVEAILLSLFTVAVAYKGPELVPLREAPLNPSFTLFWITALASMAMGLQNATITRISGAVVRTTHLTGVLTDLGLEGVQYLAWLWEKGRGRWSRAPRLWKLSRRHPSALRLLLLASIAGSFLFGTITGCLVFGRIHHIAMLAPVFFLLFLIVMDWWRPIADVRELDVLSDLELKLLGIMRDMLPPELGIYRLTTHRHTATRAPDFGLWVEHLPKHWSVIILALTPMTRLDRNAASGLSEAVDKLLGRQRRLILCGVTTWQYRTLDQLGIVAKIESENLCGDMEFAIARGIELVREQRGAPSTLR